MAADFKLVAFTPPEIVDDEPRRIVELLDSGFWRVHVRHPEASFRQIVDILSAIPTDKHRHISIHSHFGLIADFPEIGLHLNSRWNEVVGDPLCVSRSCHSLAEVKQNSDLSYVTLSPIYDSISKQGYRSNFVLNEVLKREIEGRHVIALGGVTPDKFEELQSSGFMGGAMLGHLWK